MSWLRQIIRTLLFYRQTTAITSRIEAERLKSNSTETAPDQRGVTQPNLGRTRAPRNGAVVLHELL